VCEDPSGWGNTEQPVIDALRHSCPVIHSMLDRKLVFDQNDPSTTGVGFMACVLDGVTLPAYTVYDYFGWLLSIAACPKPGATSENYYLPLLSCFANWCLKIAEHTNRPKGTVYAPMMVSIAVYKKQSRPWRPNEVNEEERAFLGVSIPDEKNLPHPSNRARVINFGRQALMKQSGFGDGSQLLALLCLRTRLYLNM
jgi:hypothetical protein